MKTDDQIRAAIKRLPRAKGFSVDNAVERQKALDIARGLGREVITRRRKDSAGFLVFAIE